MYLPANPENVALGELFNRILEELFADEHCTHIYDVTPDSIADLWW